jgi:8-oxo-dGTP pyrophosphatase MutT (NUDIX family)
MEERIAAGGIVIETGSDGVRRVLLVHRPAYDDWSFPKGKADPGETTEQTALREVKEETGLDCRLIRELGATRYDYKSRKGSLRPKVVHYFLMQKVAGEISTDGIEIDLAAWFDFDGAERLLTYDIDRDLLSRTVTSEFPESGNVQHQT